MILNDFKKNSIEAYTKCTAKLNIVENALGDCWQIPMMIAKGGDGPCLGITAALHGNELNGISTIQALWEKIDAEKLSGMVVLIPVLNIPGFLNGTREFADGKDLNRMMPGNPNGTSSEVYAAAIMQKIISQFDYLIDLHTASFGRINSLHVKANMSNPAISKLALLQNPQIIVDKQGPHGSLRHEAEKLNIPTITVEIGNPNIFQKKYITPSTEGLTNVLNDLGIMPSKHYAPQKEPVICKDSHWLYAKHAGILKVYPGLEDFVERGEKIGKITDIYGECIMHVLAPYNAIVVGKSTHPVCNVGSRVVNLGEVRG